MSSTPMHILIVEDDADNARLLELALRSTRHGSFTCKRVGSLNEAMGLSRSDVTFDAILLDLTLPDSRGMETLARVRSTFRHVPVVVLTGTSDQAAAVRALQEGAQDYLVKGQVDGDAVARSVRYVIERTRVEREHQQVRLRNELATESVGLGIWEWDLATDRLTWTKPLADLFGISELEGTFSTFNDFIPPEGERMRRAAVTRAIETRGLYRREMRVRRRDGTERWLESRGRAVYDEETGKATRMIGTMLDVTSRHEAEESAREREATVAHLARVNIIGQMASGLAHELNQPLGAILNFAAVAKTHLIGCADPAAATAAKALDEVMNESRRAAQIIRGIRDFVRKQEPNVAPIELNRAIERTIGWIGYELERASVQPETHLATDLPLVLADEVQVEQVLVNLMYNAIEAMQTIPVDDRRLIVSTHLDSARQQVRVDVVDGGVGMSQEVAARLFEPFFTTKSKGLGIGMNLSRTIIERLGGVIVAGPSPAGRGACISFTLPIATPAADGSMDAAAPQQQAQQQQQLRDKVGTAGGDSVVAEV